MPVYEANTRTPVSYTWAEESIAHYELTTDPAALTVVPADGQTEATLTNRHTPEQTTVNLTKHWDDEVEPSFRPTPEQFKQLVTLSADAATVTIPEPVLTGTDTADWTLTWSGLPVYQQGAKVNYTVTEADTGSYYVEGTVEKGTDGYTFNVTNTRDTDEKNKLTVEKTVVSSTDSDKTDVSFNFTVKITPVITGTFGDMTFDATGTAAFALHGGESRTAKGLPWGVSYVVTEEAVDGFVNTTRTGDTGTITASESKASFTNTRDEGGLIISKSVTSDITADYDLPFTFTVTLDKPITQGYGSGENLVTFRNGTATVTLKSGEQKTIEGLPTGIKATVAETTPEDFAAAFTVNGAAAEKPEAVISKSASTIAFTNTRKTGSLKITKTVESDIPADATRAFTFTVTLRNGSQPLEGVYGTTTFSAGTASVTVAGGTPLVITGIPVGTDYTVTETPDALFDNTETVAASGTITATETELEASFTNTRKTGSLKVTKAIVTSTAKYKEQEFDFTVTLGDNTVNGVYSGLTFTNGVSETFRLKDGGEQTIEGLPAGITYAVAEAPVAGFTNTAKTGDTGTIQETAATAAFTNTKDEGDIEITKGVVSVVEDDHKRTYSFTMTLSDTTLTGTYGDLEFKDGVAEFTLTDGETKAARGIPQGVTYTVAEAEDAAFTVTAAAAAGTVGKTVSRPAFTNTRKTGSLTLTKTIAMSRPFVNNEEKAHYKGKHEAFQFEITTDPALTADFTASDGSTVSFKDGKATVTVYGVLKEEGTGRLTVKGLPVDTKFTVTEQLTGTQTVVYAQADDITGTITEAGAAAAVENLHKLAHITIEKTATSKPSDGVAYYAGEKVTYKIVVKNDGELTVTDVTVTDDLTGSSWTIASFAPGEIKEYETTYTVTEKDAEAGQVLNVVTAKGTNPDPDDPDVPVTPGKTVVKTHVTFGALINQVGECFD